MGIFGFYIDSPGGNTDYGLVVADTDKDARAQVEAVADMKKETVEIVDGEEMILNQYGGLTFCTTERGACECPEPAIDEEVVEEEEEVE